MTGTQGCAAVIFLIGLWVWVYILKALFLGVVRVTKQEVIRDGAGDPILNEDGKPRFQDVEWEFHHYEFSNTDGAVAAGVATFIVLVGWCAAWIPLFYR